MERWKSETQSGDLGSVAKRTPVRSGNEQQKLLGLA